MSALWQFTQLQSSINWIAACHGDDFLRLYFGLQFTRSWHLPCRMKARDGSHEVAAGDLLNCCPCAGGPVATLQARLRCAKPNGSSKQRPQLGLLTHPCEDLQDLGWLKLSQVIKVEIQAPIDFISFTSLGALKTCSEPGPTVLSPSKTPPPTARRPAMTSFYCSAASPLQTQAPQPLLIQF
eukprot:CAMPEP_0197664464 /NCGR_PEP_ID=MMETSP1338-20131121/58647_1 /TAXON_ID=43686 ORGANISM="Pelagodinium beii, Strain RCC1491" /NCGR_SAMPLE_ID=MMETSP1338 /ASSEMBLY_ACC=CAM_ASM_000754 /LENGTH=181 /DNA_ID=CAMNT_0043243103 /DNA_START=875 /DNA_END=1421 /DNA_ORIENTATION=+